MKPYVKPELFFESFDLSQSIAACGWDMKNQSDKRSCEATGDEDWGRFPINLFTDKPRCGITEENAEGYCYEVSEDGYKLFNS